MKHIFGKKNGQSGFSLVELMIVVGIIGVLATLALPRFKQFQAKAKMAEAMNVLSHVYTLEQAYNLDNNAYLAFGALGANTGTSSGGNACTPNAATHGLLGFSIEPCVAGAAVPRFSYTAALTGATGGFTATAVTGGGASNRVCAGNGAITVTLTDRNVSTVPTNGSFTSVVPTVIPTTTTASSSSSPVVSTATPFSHTKSLRGLDLSRPFCLFHPP